MFSPEIQLEPEHVGLNQQRKQRQLKKRRCGCISTSRPRASQGTTSREGPTLSRRHQADSTDPNGLVVVVVEASERYLRQTLLLRQGGGLVVASLLKPQCCQHPRRCYRVLDVGLAGPSRTSTEQKDRVPCSPACLSQVQPWCCMGTVFL